ncbi:MAG: hypothetical protein HC822_11825 [Oscillochloris sp.]|nr:hypothetical protein [Oscillochloris sp.]
MRTSRRFYGFAASIATLSSVLAAAAISDLPLDTRPALCIVAATMMLAVAQQLRNVGRDSLALGPFWTAQATLPISLLVSLVLVGNILNPLFAITFALAAVAYGIQAFLRTDPRWLWPAVFLLFWAVEAGARSATLSSEAHAAVHLGLSVSAFALSILADRRRPNWSLPLLVLTLLAYLAAIAFGLTSLAITLSYPILIAISSGFIALLIQKRFAFLSTIHTIAATISLGVTATLSTIWVLAICVQFDLSAPIMGYAVLALALLFLTIAHSRFGKILAPFEATLRVFGAIVSIYGAIISDTTTAYALLTMLWCGEAWLRRDLIWAGVGIGTLSFTGYRLFEQLKLTDDVAMLSLGMAFIIAYAIGAALLQGRNLRHWMLAGNFWAGIITAIVLAQVVLRLTLYRAAEPLDIAVLSIFAVLSAVLTFLWRQARFGYPAAITFSAAVVLAAEQRFFMLWNPPDALLAFVLIGLSFALAFTGSSLRRIQRRYALPYEISAAVLLPFAPLFASGDRASLAAVYGSMALLYGLAVWRYRVKWPIAPALIALDLGLVHAAAWLLPSGSPSGAAWILAIAQVPRPSVHCSSQTQSNHRSRSAAGCMPMLPQASAQLDHSC